VDPALVDPALADHAHTHDRRGSNALRLDGARRAPTGSARTAAATEPRRDAHADSNDVRSQNAAERFVALFAVRGDLRGALRNKLVSARSVLSECERCLRAARPRIGGWIANFNPTFAGSESIAREPSSAHLRRVASDDLPAKREPNCGVDALIRTSLVGVGRGQAGRGQAGRGQAGRGQAGRVQAGHATTEALPSPEFAHSEWASAAVFTSLLAMLFML